MKIATLTYQRHDNYGAMLQCYALQQKLSALGVETEVIDYVCEVAEKPYGIAAYKAKGTKRYITGNIGAVTRLPRAKKFKAFRQNYLKMTAPYTKQNISRIGAVYDGYIVGSDNVWNADITGLDERYFLSFVADKRKRASYAASFGSSQISHSHVRKYTELLNDMAVLNVREQSGADLIHRLTDRDASVVCDPTLLLSADQWKKIAVSPKNQQKYLLAYQMVPSAEFVRFVDAVAKQKGLQVVYVPFPYGPIKCQMKFDIGPLEWLGLFQNAEFILTDSFHGCVFSTIFHKEFAVKISQLGERIQNLLSVLDISDRVVASAQEAVRLNRINYDEVQKRMDLFREESEAKLKETLDYFQTVAESGKNGIVDESMCTGCFLCQKVCPRGAIQIKKDDLGFSYPDINASLCVHCHLCESECSAIRLHTQESKRQYFSAINQNDRIVHNSASGGVYPALAEAVLSRGGAVFGAGYGRNFAIEHQCITETDQIKKLQGVKYPQSNMIACYSRIAELLNQGTTVLFFGTPCQCAAIKEYLVFKKISTDHLYLVDLFCNGVFSPGIWEDYISHIESKFGAINYISFRDKSLGWRNKHFKIIAGKKNVSGYCNDQASLLRMYEMKIGFRESCYQCPYMKIERAGDLSIGDFWGIERIRADLDHNTGVSAVIVNNEKGKNLLRLAAASLCLTEFSEKEILQPVLKGFNTKHSQRSEFVAVYQEKGLNGLIQRYGQVKGAHKLKRDYMIPALYQCNLAGVASKILHYKD